MRKFSLFLKFEKGISNLDGGDITDSRAVAAEVLCLKITPHPHTEREARL